ncbi:MAG: hypothetical protein F4053_04250 [Proteobacteria bacterium]|nr:hypothetical protein [Pseudomonadota bacterium]
MIMAAIECVDLISIPPTENSYLQKSVTECNVETAAVSTKRASGSLRHLYIVAEQDLHQTIARP